MGETRESERARNESAPSVINFKVASGSGSGSGFSHILKRKKRLSGNVYKVTKKRIFFTPKKSVCYKIVF